MSYNETSKILKDAFNNIIHEFLRDEYNKQKKNEEKFQKLKDDVLTLTEHMFEDKMTKEDETLMMHIYKNTHK